MSTFKDIQIALDTRLSQMPNQMPIAWENTMFTPVKDQAWCRPTVMNGPSTTINITNGNILRPGIYQIDLFYPANAGTKQLMAKIDEIFALFKATSELSSNATTVLIRSVSATAKTIDDIWFMGSIKIIFESYDN